jgi:hypothetical protein
VSARAKERATKRALRIQEARADARAEFMTNARQRGASAYDARTGNVDSRSGEALFKLASRPGFQSTRVVLGRTRRRAGDAAIVLVRNRNTDCAQGMKTGELPAEPTRQAREIACPSKGYGEP